MVEVAGASHMMAGIQTSGSAESGFGISLHGFHCKTLELSARLDELISRIGYANDFTTFEENGYVTFLAMTRESYQIPDKKKIVTFRREPHKFFADLPSFLSKSKAQFIDRMALTGSLGSISLTLLYRPVSDGV